MTVSEDWRIEIKAWLEANYPEALRGPTSADWVDVWGGSRQQYPVPAAKVWLERAASQGWIAPTWPAEYGGAGLSEGDARVLQQEMRTFGARAPIVRMNQGLTMLGPVLLEYGSEAQRLRFLPPIAGGEVRWCQGYSEPEAGSDLANVQTRAELIDGVYRVTGHKTWSSYAHLSDWIFCLVRTDRTASKQSGISFLLIELDNPRITIEPITLISGKSDFCEVFFDDIEVPVDQLVGIPGQGWTIAKRLLQHERAMLGSAGSGLSGGTSKRAGLSETARHLIGMDEKCLSDPVVRHRLARHLVDVAALKALGRLCADERRRDPHLPSVLKLVSTEVNMAREDLIAEMSGLSGAAWSGPNFDQAQLAQARGWLRSRANSIEGGTSEIQLNIIAKQGLGLIGGGSR